jgi:endonuclease YncB( thermonuclease family)
LRLAAIEVPSSNRATLLNLVAGQVLRLEKLGSDHDHYGRLVPFVLAGDAKQAVPQALPMESAAQVPAPVGDMARADALLAAARTARAGRRGLWGNPNFAPFAR